MRTLMRISMDVGASNAAIKDGRLPKLIQDTLNSLKPEASYFYPEHGKRAAMFVFDLTDSSQIPVLAEPWFLETGASVEMFPVMNADEVSRGVLKAMEAMVQPA